MSSISPTPTVDGGSGILSSSPSSSSSSPPLAAAPSLVRLSPRGFRLCWWFLVAYHLFNACFALLLAFVHVMASTSAVYPNMWMLGIHQRTLAVSGWTYAAVAALQLLTVGLHITQSLRRRELSFGYDDDVSETEFSTFSTVSTVSTVSSTRLPQQRRSRWRLQSDTFEVLFQLRQLIEILMQTYQANMLSRSVARRDLQLMVVASVVANCVHTPLYDWYTARRSSAHHRHRHRHGRQSATRGSNGRQSATRLVVLSAVDIALDFVVAVGLPIAILVPRLRQFDFAQSRFSLELTFDDVWNTQAVSEGRQVLVSSALDYVSSISPHMLGMLSLRFIKSKLRRRRRPTPSAKQIAPSPRRSMAALHAIHPATHDGSGMAVAATTRTSSTRSTSSEPRRWTVLVVQLMHLVAVLWAVLVLSLHTRAQHGHDRIEGCQVVFPAWLARRAPCAALQFNCHARGELAGTAVEVHEALAQMEPSVLRLVVFSHCPALEIPPILLREFRKLNVLAVFNSTIHKWDATASLSRVWTPLLSQLQFVDTNMTAIPQGLLHEELPGVMGLLVFRSNLSSIPSDIGALWRRVRWTALWLEYTQLTELPESFCELQVTKLSLEGSPVTHLPAQIFNTISATTTSSTMMMKKLTVVRLSKTRIQSLPMAMHSSASLKIFLADHTNVTHVPEWLRTWAATVDKAHVVSLVGSPVCALDDDGANAALCHVVDHSKRNLLPYHVIAAQRPLTGN